MNIVFSEKKLRKFSKKIFFSFIIIIFVLFVFANQAWAAASLSFSPASKTVALNETFSVDVMLSTGGAETDGTDAIVMYDANKLQVTAASLGNLYANKLIADTSTLGKIVFRATSTADQSYNGTGTFATITFKAYASGTQAAEVYFQFTSGSTTDSNVAYQGSDLLGSVSNASYTISSAAASPAAGGVATSPTPSVPVSGSTTPTIFLLAGGLLLFLLGALKLALLKN